MSLDESGRIRASGETHDTCDLFSLRASTWIEFVLYLVSDHDVPRGPSSDVILLSLVITVLLWWLFA